MGTIKKELDKPIEMKSLPDRIDRSGKV